MIKAVLSDVGNVLLRLKTEDFLARVAAACPRLDRDTMLSELRGRENLHDQYERGKVSGRDFHARFVAVYGLPWGFEEWVAQWNDYFLVNRPMEVLVSKLRGKVKLWGLSNTNAEHHTHFTRNYRIFEAFEEVLGSHQFGARKPEPEFFRAAIRRIGCEPGEIFFMDDVKDFVAAARVQGMEAFNYTFNDLELKARLRELGLDLPELENLPSNMSC